MADGKDNLPPSTGTRRLADAVRAAKIAAAHRSDVVVDIREADRARLEILVEVLQPVIDDVPAGDDFLDLAISGGPQPRFWIDGTAHVTMARDRRTYRFVRETRLGRLTLLESTDLHAVADRVTTYVAERLVDREKAFAETDERPPARPAPERVDAEAAPIRAAPPPERRSGAGAALAWFLFGLATGAGILFALASVRGLTLR